MQLLTPGLAGVCTSPSVVDGQVVACRQCRECRGLRVADLVGRCMAEKSTSSRTVAVTLTYAGDSVNAATLQYRDVQLLLKRLRRADYSVRYLCAGEYGASKARAHWHIVLFFNGLFPDLPVESRITWPFWPHGLVYAQEPDADGFAYLMKYALKSQADGNANRFVRMSKYPPLGSSFFESLARDMVSQGLAFHAPEYSFADDVRYDERQRRWVHRKYRACNTSLWRWMELYVEEWQAKHTRPVPDTEFLMENYFDVIARREMDGDPFFVERAIKLRARPRPAVVVGDYPKQVGFLVCPASQAGLFVLYDDGTAHFVRNEARWHLDVGGPIDLGAQLAGVPGLAAQDARAFRAWSSQLLRDLSRASISAAAMSGSRS